MRYHLRSWLTLALAVLVGAMPIAAQDETAVEMATTAGLLLDRFEGGAVAAAEGDAKIQLPFDSEQRADWHFIPKEHRKGLPLKAMRPDQGQLAHALLAASLSRQGYGKAVRIMSLEKILFDLETEAGANPFTRLREADGYYFTVFGDPTGSQPWGWSVEGHHVSLNYTVVDGRVASSPMFFGTNPHQVPSGPARGLRVLGEEEDVARALLASLDEAQLEKAVLGDKAPNDIFTSADREVEFEKPPRGLAAKEMSASQRETLKSLIELYVRNVPADLAARRRAQMESDFDAIRFAWIGPTEKAPGNGHYYRVQAPTFLIEYDNVQNNANHSHTVWRDYDGDFGRDLLREHRLAAH